LSRHPQYNPQGSENPGDGTITTGRGKGFHAHNQVCLDIYTLFGFFGWALKVLSFI